MRAPPGTRGFALWLAIFAACTTHCSSTSKTEKAPACAPGKTQACIGLQGCNGAQTCKPDGTGFTPCECFAATGGSAGLGGTSGSGATSGRGGVGGASGTDGAAGIGGANGASGSTGTSGSGGAGGESGDGGTAGIGGSAGIPGDASMGCIQECMPLVNACASNPAKQCMCDQCGCQVVTCLRNTQCLNVAMCAVQSCTDYSSCLGNNGPCGAVFNQLPPSMQMLALALGTCLLNKSCPTCSSSN